MANTHAPFDDHRFRSGALVIRCGPDQVQLGFDRRWALRLDGVADNEAGWLADLADRPHVSLSASAALFDVSEARRDEISAGLARAGYLIRRERDVGRGEVRAPGDGAGELPTLNNLRPDGFGRHTLARRAQVAVCVSDLGRLGLALSTTLALAGVGELIAPDRGVVLDTDVGPGGASSTDVGRPRIEVLANAVARLAPKVRVHSDGEADLIVALDGYVPNPLRWVQLLAERLPHLSIRIGEANVTVGPFVLPGKPPCLNCVDLHHAGADPGWPEVAAHLYRARPPAVEIALCTMAAGYAAAQVLAYLDGVVPQTAGREVEFALPQGSVTRSTIAPHPACGCLDLGKALRTRPPRTHPGVVLFTPAGTA